MTERRLARSRDPRTGYAPQRAPERLSDIIDVKWVFAESNSIPGSLR
jgi:hypothetical protein